MADDSQPVEQGDLTVEQLAKAVREKYPNSQTYKNASDSDLVTAYVEKHPAYAMRVKWPQQKIDPGWMRAYHAVGENIKAPFQGAANMVQDILGITKNPQGRSEERRVG